MTAHSALEEVRFEPTTLTLVWGMGVASLRQLRSLRPHIKSCNAKERRGVWLRSDWHGQTKAV